MIQNAVILSCDKMAILPQIFGPNSCKVLARIQVHQNCRCTVVDRVYKKKRSAEYTITNITLGSALKSWFE